MPVGSPSLTQSSPNLGSPSVVQSDPTPDLGPNFRPYERAIRRKSSKPELPLGTVVSGTWEVISPRMNLLTAGEQTLAYRVRCVGCGEERTKTQPSLLRLEQFPQRCKSCVQRHDAVAFGEAPRPISEWAKHEKCRVNYDCLKTRLALGWDLERAMTQEIAHLSHEAFGEKKSLREWAADPRCVLDYPALKNRVCKRWPLEDALTTPRGKNAPTRVSAFGESKTPEEWAADPRCVVPYRTLRDRLYDGWPGELAMSHPKGRPRPAIAPSDAPG